MIKKTLCASAMFAVATMLVAQASAQEPLPNHLFGQYSTQGANQVNASMYPAPHPVPNYVGSSAYTYQPLMPHEMMYTHSRNYYNYTGGAEQNYRDPYGSHWFPGGSSMNVTKVRWQSGAIGFSPLPFSAQPFAPLRYKWNKHWYRTHGNQSMGVGSGGISAPIQSSCDGGYSMDYSLPSAGGCSGGCTASLTDRNISR